MQESRRTAQLPESATLGLAARAAAMKLDGIDVLSMAVGEPDFDAPLAAREAAKAAVDSGAVKYTAASGAPGLKAALAGHLLETRGVSYAPNQIVVGHSCKHALSNALLALVNPGDQVVLVDPSWSSYDAQIDLAEGTAVHVAPRPDLGPDLGAIEAAVGPETRGVMINTPSNPSGYVWTRDEVGALMELAEAKDLWVLSDEIYRRLVYADAQFTSPASLSAKAAARTVIVDGASKSYAMTGYRIGFLAGPANLADAVARLQSQTTGCPNYISQCAYEAVLTVEPPEVASMTATFDARRRLLVDGLVGLGLETPEPLGAFYAFPRVAGLCDERGVDGFCEDLLNEEALVVVPGTAFGLEGHIRFSYALATERIENALERLGRFLANRS